LAKGSRTTGLLACAAAFALGAGSTRCSSDDERPPPYVHPGIDEPRSCSELVTRGSLDGSEIHVDGERAHCAVADLECVLEGTLEFSLRCDAGKASAFCSANVWRFSCGSLTDAGIEGGS
jgi:hypothetical protein